MRLSAFIRENIELILAEWEAFARTLPQSEAMDIAALRDHASGMLRVVADDLDRPQTPKEQAEKARGESDAEAGAVATAAQRHGAGRAESGFTVAQMVAEFRALRASVLRLWCQMHPSSATTDLEDLIRFNEAIDQAITESINRYAADVGQSKERFLAILGHDLGNPLGAVIMSATFMLENATQHADLPQPYLALTEGIAGSARRMHHMVTDLLEFARVSFGQTIPIERVPVDIEQLVRDVAAEARASDRKREIRTKFVGDLCGQWDRERLFQALGNLVGNAVQHGSPAAPVSITANGDANMVRNGLRRSPRAREPGQEPERVGVDLGEAPECVPRGEPDRTEGRTSGARPGQAVNMCRTARDRHTDFLRNPSSTHSLTRALSTGAARIATGFVIIAIAVVRMTINLARISATAGEETQRSGNLGEGNAIGLANTFRCWNAPWRPLISLVPPGGMPPDG